MLKANLIIRRHLLKRAYDVAKYILQKAVTSQFYRRVTLITLEDTVQAFFL